MITLKQKPNGIYYLDVRLPDEAGDLKRTRVSLDTRDRADAEGQRRDWLAGRHPKHPAVGGVIAAKGREPQPESSPQRKITPTEMTVERWLYGCLDTIWNARKGVVKNDRTHRSNIKVLCRYLPEDLLLADLDKAELITIEQRLWDAGYKPGSIQKLLNALSSALTHAAAQGLITARPVFPKITVKNTKDRVITLDEERAMLECIEARIHAEPLRPWWEFKMLTIVLADTAFRIGEALQLGPGSINRVRWLDQYTGEHHEGIYLLLRQYTTKNDKPRQVPVTARVLSILPELNARAKAGLWFPWKNGSSGIHYLLTNLREDMKAKGFNIDDVSMHTWRHTCATRLAQGGMDLIGLRDWLGHSDIKITAQRYVHLMVGHIYRGTTILDAYRDHIPQPKGIEQTMAAPLSMPDNQVQGNYGATHVTPLPH
jgi:integrase